MPINAKKLKVALVERGLPQWKLARLIRVQPSTLSDYLRGARRAPVGLQKRIEEALGVSRGGLAGRLKRTQSHNHGR